MVRRKTGSLLGAIYVLISAILLGAALFSPWYYDDHLIVWWSDSSPVGSGTTYYLFSLPGSGPVQACPTRTMPNPGPTSSSYSDAGLNSTKISCAGRRASRCAVYRTTAE